MKTIEIEVFGKRVEVDYGFEVRSRGTRHVPPTEGIEIHEYRFKTKEDREDCEVDTEAGRWFFEDELAQRVMDYERGLKAKGGWIAPYSTVRMRRKMTTI